MNSRLCRFYRFLTIIRKFLNVIWSKFLGHFGSFGPLQHIFVACLILQQSRQGGNVATNVFLLASFPFCCTSSSRMRFVQVLMTWLKLFSAYELRFYRSLFFFRFCCLRMLIFSTVPRPLCSSSESKYENLAIVLSSIWTEFSEPLWNVSFFGKQKNFQSFVEQRFLMFFLCVCSTRKS